MTDRTSFRPSPIITDDMLLDEQNWRGQTAADLKRRLKAATLRRTARLLGLAVERRTAHACALAIASHAARLDQGA